MKSFPTTNVFDFLRLARSAAQELVSRPFNWDFKSVLCRWMRDLIERRQSQNVVLNFWVKKMLLVFGQDLSAHILSKHPSEASYIEGHTKKKAMSFLAPEALVVCHGEKWERLRVFNEKVLCADEPHIYQQEFLNCVRSNFASPVSDFMDLRRRMQRVMLDIVFGDGSAPLELAEDVQVLFGLVQSPLKRMLFGFSEKKRREKFYRSLREIWEKTDATEKPSLISRAHEFAGANDEAELIQQIPHWMFTFTNSGTDLLARTLALISSRQVVRTRALNEIAHRGSLENASTIERLNYLEACLLESARLFSPVPMTFHCAAQNDDFCGLRIPAKTEIVHYFPLNQRDSKRDPTADSFLPERWLDPTSPAYSDYPNLFLSGARACPGRNLILFVCKSAIAILLEKHDLYLTNKTLVKDPVPFSFSEKEIKFYA